MLKKHIYSDRIYRWSDINERQAYILLTPKANYPFETVIRTGTIRYTRLFDRTIQTLRQKRMQMYEWERAWSQILFNTQCLQKESGCYLRSHRPSRKGEKASFTFSKCTITIERNLRHKPRTSQKKRTFLNKLYGKHRCLLYVDKRRFVWSTCCEYDRKFYIMSTNYCLTKGGW